MRPLIKSVLDNLVCPNTGKTLHVAESQLLALYFSSGTCHLTSSTTEQLITYYDNIRQLHPTSLEVVLISADESEEELKQHSRCMPWPALHFGKKQIKKRLYNLYRITSLLYIVFIDLKSGKVVLKGGPEILESEVAKIKFPIENKTLQSILTKSNMVDCYGKEITCKDVIKGYTALYFGANWCPPCKSFSLQLKKFYEEIEKKRDDFEILFVSSDRCETSWNLIRESMPWPSVSWNDESSRKDLAMTLEVNSIPALVLVDKSFSVVSWNCKNYLKEDLKGENFPWKMNHTELLKEIHMPLILEKPSIILFTDGEDVNLCLEILSAASEEYYSKYSRESCSSLLFFVAGEDDVSDIVRDYINIEDDVVPLLLLIDLSEGIKYEFSDYLELTPVSISDFVNRYMNNELEGVFIEDSGRAV